uniref:Uncharacterized protein n=1 Tax=Glossina austeni TaxID=7395 RepID=A0A1A9UDT3_GLOAU
DVRCNNDKNLTYSVSYIPKLEREDKGFVKLSCRDIPKSPLYVNVEAHAGDASKVKVTSPDVQPMGVVVSKPTFFNILTIDAGRGVPEVIIIDPATYKTFVAAKVRQIENDLPSSPFPVKIAPLSGVRKVKSSGRGLQPNGIRVGDDADFKIYTEGGGEECHYFPLKEGRYVAVVTFAGQEINKSPFEVKVGSKKDSNIVAFGPGMRGGVVGYPAAFVVETNGETGALGFTVAGPSQAETEFHDNGDGSALAKYHPTATEE